MQFGVAENKMVSLLSENFVRVLEGKNSAWEAMIVIFFHSLNRVWDIVAFPTVTAAAEVSLSLPS